MRKEFILLCKYVKQVPTMHRHICEHEIIIIKNWKAECFLFSYILCGWRSDLTSHERLKKIVKGEL